MGELCYVRIVRGRIVRGRIVLWKNCAWKNCVWKNCVWKNCGRPFSEFKTNCCFYAFDFSPDRSVGCSSGHISLAKQGNLKVEIHFSTAPTKALKLMIFAEFDSTIEITKNREVISDY